LGTSDGVGAQLPAKNRPAEPGWRPGGDLSPLEEEMVAGAAAGELVERGAGPFNLAEMQAWGKERTVRAAVLRHLLVAGQWPVHAKGVRLRGVRISDCLDLEAATLRCPLSLECCYLDADDPACLDSATASRVALTGCELAGLTGEMLTARKLDLSGSTLTGPLVLLNADIAGALFCRGARLTGRDSDGYALSAARVKVGGNVFLTGGFTAAGAVCLADAEISGQLNCGGARLTGRDSGGYALFASGIKARSGVLLTGGFTAAGAVWLAGADIAGALFCDGARLTGRDSGGYALSASGIKARIGVLLTGGFTAAGAVCLDNAEISGQLNCGGARLTGRDSGGYALSAEGVKVGGDVFLTGGFTAAGAVWLADAEIGGQLNCGGAQLTRSDNNSYALSAAGVKVGGDVLLDEGFTAAGAVQLAGADIAGGLSCHGAWLTGTDSDGYALSAAAIKARIGVLLTGGFTAAGAVCLDNAEISGQLNCDGAQLTGRDSDGYALAAGAIKCGNVSLGEGFTAGAVQLVGADIARDLGCLGARLTGRDKDGYALSAARVKVGGNVFLTGGFTAAGAVQLTVADIVGQLNCGGARLTGRDKDGYALSAAAIKVGGNVVFTEGFTAGGGISLISARLSHSLVVMPTRLAGNKEDAEQAEVVSLNAFHAQITDVLRWQPAEQVRGQVNLQGAVVGELRDDWTSGRANGYWPSGGRLSLDGFTYGRFGGDQQASVKQRLAWIWSQYRRSGTGWHGFATQPYEQLAAVYWQAGQDTQARKVAIARRADLRKYGNLNRYRRFGDWFLDKTVKYGFQVWRAAAGLAVVFVAFLALSIVGQHQHVIVPVGEITGLHPVPSATQCTSNYPCFYPAGYAVDTVIPIINVHQASYWGPDAHAPWGWVWVGLTWVATGLGWALVTLLVVGYTGLVRQDLKKS